MKGKKLYSFVEIDDRTPIQKLKIADQLRALLRRLTYSAANDLKTEDAATAYFLTLKANLLEFIQKSTEPIKRGEHRSVTLVISGKFSPVLEEVLASPHVAPFYLIDVDRPDMDYDIPYTIEVRLEVRTD
jgi:hypothetical protein